MSQGQPGESLFMISIGTCEVLYNNHCIRELGAEVIENEENCLETGAGDVFGELCALGQASMPRSPCQGAARTRSSTVRCKDIADVYVLSKADLSVARK